VSLFEVSREQLFTDADRWFPRLSFQQPKLYDTASSDMSFSDKTGVPDRHLVRRCAWRGLVELSKHEREARMETLAQDVASFEQIDLGVSAQP